MFSKSFLVQGIVCIGFTALPQRGATEDIRMVFHQPIFFKLIFSGKLHLHIGLKICGSQCEISQHITRGHGDVTRKKYFSIHLHSLTQWMRYPKKLCICFKKKVFFLLVKVLHYPNQFSMQKHCNIVSSISMISISTSP